MKKLRPEYVASVAQNIQLIAIRSILGPDCELPPSTLNNCCAQVVDELEKEANDLENKNYRYVFASTRYEYNGKVGWAYFCARIKEDFYDDSAATLDVPVSVRGSEARKKERIRALRLSISDYLSKIERAAHGGAENPLFVADDIAAWAALVQSETKELAKLDPKMVEKWKKIHESFLAI